MNKLCLIAAVASLALMAGCEKKVQMTFVNHTDSPRTIQVSTPDETMTLGQVSPGGQLSHKVAIKTDDLPAQVNISADGASTNCMVTHHTPKAWWFHIEPSGVAGPYGKDDVHSRDVEGGTIEMRTEPRMIVR
jgi:hypothetical protein